MPTFEHANGKPMATDNRYVVKIKAYIGENTVLECPTELYSRGVSEKQAANNVRYRVYKLHESASAIKWIEDVKQVAHRQRQGVSFKFEATKSPDLLPDAPPQAVQKDLLPNPKPKKMEQGKLFPWASWYGLAKQAEDKGNNSKQTE